MWTREYTSRASIVPLKVTATREALKEKLLEEGEEGGGY
jgi:hypothetical protein